MAVGVGTRSCTTMGTTSRPWSTTTVGTTTATTTTGGDEGTRGDFRSQKGNYDEKDFFSDRDGAGGDHYWLRLGVPTWWPCVRVDPCHLQ